MEAIAGRQVTVTSVKKDSIERIDGWTLSADELELTADRGGAVRLTRRARRERRAKKSGARVVELAYQGETKKALVDLSPIEWNARSGRLSIARRLTVRLSFTKRDRGDRFRVRPSQRKRRVATRLVTTAPGLHQVSYQDVFHGRKIIAARRLRLSRLGEDVPYHIEPEARRFGPGSTLYFVAEGADKNPYAKESIYELELGVAGARMDVVGDEAGGATLQHYWQRIEHEENRLYQAASSGL